MTTFAAGPAAPAKPDVSGTPGTGTAAATAVLDRAAALVGPALDQAARRLDDELRPPVVHHLEGGGKRVRAALVLLSAAAAGATEELAMDGAVAVELVHNFSLLHDDIIDGDQERRHRPTAWTKYGVGAAIVAGDALVTLAMEILLDRPTAERVQAARLLATATQAMIAGQATDMAFESRGSVTVDECLAMEEGKTGALLSCAASLGAVMAGAPAATVAALADFGTHLGIAFQAVDDVLGIWGEPSVTGKPVGSDLVARKKSLPVAVALGHAASAAQLRQLLEGPLSPADVVRATALVDASDARREVLAIADRHLGAALDALDRPAIDPRARAELAAVAHFVTARDR